jgi:hypothetical protein
MQRQRKERRRMEAEMKMEFFSAARYVSLFEAVLVCRVAASRFGAGIRPLAEQVAQPDAGKLCASSCRSSGAG